MTIASRPTLNAPWRSGSLGNPSDPSGVLPPEELAGALRQQPLQPSLWDNVSTLKHIFRDCFDLVVHLVAPRSGPLACLVYIDGLVDKSLIDRHIVQPLVLGSAVADLVQVAAGLTTASESHVLGTVGEAVDRVLGGYALLLVDGAPHVVAYGVRGWQSRPVQEPITEATIRGPREGFVETLRLNTALLRRKIRSPALKMVARKIGRITQTDVCVAYIEGIASPAVVQEVFRRLDRIDIDGVLEGGYVEELIQDSPFSPFPQVQNTERPDTAAAQLLEGRVAILVDGSPFALIVPVVFAQLMQASEDYYERFWISSSIRALRHFFLLVALVFPSLYIAITTFHQEMLPSSLLETIAFAREGVPFPALVEALVMEIMFEILREAGIRLPQPVGQAISIVGTLVVGQTAVNAGLASAPMVIVVAITGISSFAVPKYNGAIAIRLLRFPLMLLAGTLGMFGVTAGLGAILLHLCSLRSFGIPYLSPMAPLSWSDLKDVVLRAPHFWMRLRPRLIGRANRVRMGSGLRPGPHHGPSRG